MGSGIAVTTDEDARLLEVIRSTVNAEVIVDVGASNAAWTYRACRVFPSARYHLFEPIWAVSNHYKIGPIYEHLSKIANVTLHPIAIGSKDGKATLHVTDDPVGSTTLNWDYAKSTPAAVPVRTIDSLVSDGTMPTPDIIKMDIQGAEMDALRGSATTLSHVSALFLETWLRPGYGEHTPLLRDIMNFLHDFGFSAIDFGGTYRQDGRLFAIDTVFARI